jgi:hypothetical protein
MFEEDEPDIDDNELLCLSSSRSDSVAGAYPKLALDLAGFVHLGPPFASTSMLRKNAQAVRSSRASRPSSASPGSSA